MRWPSYELEERIAWPKTGGSICVYLQSYGLGGPAEPAGQGANVGWGLLVLGLQRANPKPPEHCERGDRAEHS